MPPPVRKAIRQSTSSPSRNKRRKPRKKSPGNRAFFMWAPKEGGGLTLRAANAHSSTERGRFYILRLHGQAKSMAGKGKTAGRGGERGGRPGPRPPRSPFDPVFRERGSPPPRREGPEGQGGPGPAPG